MEVVQEELHRFRETIGSLRWDRRLVAPASTVCSLSTAAPTSEWSFIYGELNKLSERMDRLEESLQREGRWPRRRCRRGKLRCHRCQQPGHIARHCRAAPPIPAGRRQPSEAANPAPEIDARDSAVSTAAVERDERSNGVDRESVRSLTDTSSNMAAVSQVSPDKPRGRRRRARRKNASPRPLMRCRTQRQGVWLSRNVTGQTPFPGWNLQSRESVSQLRAAHRRPLPYVMPHNIVSCLCV